MHGQSYMLRLQQLCWMLAATLRENIQLYPARLPRLPAIQDLP